MIFAPFCLQFPKISQRETVVILSRKPEITGVPAGDYILLEYYCPDKDCDCRKVIIAVNPRNQPGIVLASIGYGWETQKFYTKWMSGDKSAAKSLVGAYLEPVGVQSRHSQYFLARFKEICLDKKFQSTIKRHYRLFKEKMRELKVNDPCPCGSGKEYKRCCLYAI